MRFLEQRVVPRLDEGEHRRAVLGAVSISVRSRRPASERCSVRGIGVAVSVSTSDRQLQRLEPLLVPHAEAMLFVDDDQAEVLERTSRDSSRCVPITMSSVPSASRTSVAA